MTLKIFDNQYGRLSYRHLGFLFVLCVKIKCLGVFWHHF